MSHGRATLKAVAALAQVSISTASLVFSGKARVSPKTEARVRAAAAELGYVGPDPLASSLRAGRSGVVAVVVDSPLALALRDPYALSVLDGLADELEADQLGLLLLAQDPRHPDVLAARVSMLAMDAAVLPFCGLADSPVVEALCARGIPVIDDGSSAHPSVLHVRTDERAAQALAVDHLQELGHRRLGLIAMPLTPRATTALIDPARLGAPNQRPDARDRALGFREAAVVHSPIAEAAAADVTQGEAAARLLLGLPAQQRPTAIVAQSDLLAAGAIRAAEALGLRVPEDVSVTGFDGVDLPWLDHTLTTIVQPSTVKGRAMGQLVRALVAGQSPSDVTFDVALRRGTTTQTPRD